MQGKETTGELKVKANKSELKSINYSYFPLQTHFINLTHAYKG